jgi:hypothetical protein
VTFVTRARPQLAAEPNGIEDLDPAGRRADEALRAELPENSGHNFADRPHAVGEILLTHEGRQTTDWPRSSRCQIEKMASNSLANRSERVACELLEDVVEAMDRFLGE